MQDEFENKRKKTNVVVHSIYDYVMGVLWLCLGCFFLLHKKFNVELWLDQRNEVLLIIFGVVAIMYGLFRIYRGYKKNY